MPEAAPWCLYLLECRNGAYYAGITNRLEARYAAHLAGTGAKYTRANPPVRVVASRAYPDRSAASRAEAQLKRLPRSKKLAFFDQASCWSAVIGGPGNQTLAGGWSPRPARRPTAPQGRDSRRSYSGTRSRLTQRLGSAGGSAA